jgi:hypothetical protein
MIQTIKRLALPLIMILALAVLASEAIAATPDAGQKPHPVPAIGPAILVDSTGKQIGPFAWNPFQPGFSIPLGRPEYPTVLLKINGEWVAVFADYDGFGNQDGFLFYTTNDCTGTAYFAVFFEGRPVVSPSITSGGILHYVNA